MRENDFFTFSFPATLTLKFAPVQCYVSTKVEVSTAFLFSRKSEVREGRTDGIQYLMRPL